MFLQIKWGFLKEIQQKDILKDDYILEYWEITIIDKDKRDLRPYVEDMLRQMNIETWQIRLLKLMIILIWFMSILIWILIFSSFSSWSKIKKLNDNVTNINTNMESIKSIQQTSTPIQQLPENFKNIDSKAQSESNSKILRGWFIK